MIRGGENIKNVSLTKKFMASKITVAGINQKMRKFIVIESSSARAEIKDTGPWGEFC
jgi:hypothetical protein